MDRIAIYAKSQDETRLRNMIDFCKNRIKDEISEEAANNVLIYKDLTSSFEEQVDLQRLLADIKENKIDKLYVDELTVFGHQMNTIHEICHKIFDNNCQIYSAYNLDPVNPLYLDIEQAKNDKQNKYYKRSISRNLREKENTITLYRILNAEINDYGNNDKTHDNTLWYGGEVASIKTPKGTYKIIARGQVRCNLIAKKDFIDDKGIEFKEGNVVASVIDKNEDGLFKKVMSPYIIDDADLDDILAHEHDLYELEITNNNWFDLEFYNKDDSLEYDDYILDSDSLSDAICEVEDLIWEQNKDGKFRAIYCRVAHKSSISKDTLNSQEKFCLDYIHKHPDGESEVIKVYKDNCSSNTNMNHKLGVLLNDIKNNRVEEIVTVKMDRLSRDLDKICEIKEILQSKNTDVFFIAQNKFLVKDLSNEISLLSGLKTIMPPEESVEQNEEMEEIEYE